MEQNIAESPHLLNAWVWVEKNRKQVLLGVGAVVAVGLIIGYTSWARAAKEEAAGQALSAALFSGLGNRTQGADAGAELLKVAAENSGTQPGAQALLLAGGVLFNGGKYTEAQSAFDQFARELHCDRHDGEPVHRLSGKMSEDAFTAVHAGAFVE